MSLHCAITPATIICNSINILGAWDLPEYYQTTMCSPRVLTLEVFPG